MDWEGKANKLVESVKLLAILLGVIGVWQAWTASGWEVGAWLMVVWVAISAYDDAKIKP